MNINLLLVGQSNATYFVGDGCLAAVANILQGWLGFDGVNNRVN
jgi:hypothetical protein